MREKQYVAVFFSDGKPHRLAPTTLLVVTNYSAGLGRTLHHRGFHTGPLALRQLTPQEQEQAAGHYRFHMVFYDSWQELVGDEQQFLQEDPGIGTHFLSVCQACAADRLYTPRSLPKRAGRPASTEAIELVQRPELEAAFTPEELAAAEEVFRRAA